MPGCCQKTVVTMLLNHRVFEGLFDDRGATFDGRSLIFKKRWFSDVYGLQVHGR